MWRGDGSCDDGNNNIDCNFDDGDCCGSCVNRQYCTDCLCLFEDSASIGDIIFVGNGFYYQPNFKDFRVLGRVCGDKFHILFNQKM